MHALIGRIVEKYALNNELRLIARVWVNTYAGSHLQMNDAIAIRLPRPHYLLSEFDVL